MHSDRKTTCNYRRPKRAKRKAAAAVSASANVVHTDDAEESQTTQTGGLKPVEERPTTETDSLSLNTESVPRPDDVAVDASQSIGDAVASTSAGRTYVTWCISFRRSIVCSDRVYHLRS